MLQLMERGQESREAGLFLKLEMTCKVNFHSHPIGLDLSSRATFTCKAFWEMLFLAGCFGLSFNSIAME